MIIAIQVCTKFCTFNDNFKNEDYEESKVVFYKLIINLYEYFNGGAT
jgi:hypothetical protein